MNNKYNAGIYIRLSKEDSCKLNYSESIKNQRVLLEQYVKENNYNLIDTYIDDGYSGTNYDRPSFRRLIKDIEKGIINMVITKDLSRLGRDYIKTGEYLEKYFPMHNIRYISISDNIDTYLDSSNNDFMPFKVLLNDMYAKDISKKIRTSLMAKQKEGLFVGARSPYGYSKDINNKNKLVIDKETSSIVKRIFNMSLEGYSCYKIAAILTKENIKTPSYYNNFNIKKVNVNRWNSKTIKNILTNRIYVGDMVQHKSIKLNYKLKKVINTNKEDYIIVKNTHEAIISKDIYNRVQSIIKKNNVRYNKIEYYLLDNLLYCGDCKHKLSITPRRKIDNKCYTICNGYRENICKIHSNNYDYLEEIILDKIYNIILNHLDIKYIKDNLKIITSKKDNLKILFNEREVINNNLDSIYLDRINNVIDIDKYNRILNKLMIRKDNIDNKINKLSSNKDINYDKLINNYIYNIRNRILLLNIIDKIEIFNNNDIVIKLSFK